MLGSLITRRMAPWSLLLSLCVVPFIPPAHAEEAESPETSVRLSGFATLGLTHNDNGDRGAIVAFSQKHPVREGYSGNLDSVAGVQLEWLPIQNTSFVLQGVARAGNNFDPQLRMGYVRQQLGNEFAARVGRIRSPLYLDSDVVEIGYAYLMTRPPLPLYGIANNIASVDGGDLQWRHTFGNTAILLQGYYGQNDYKQRFYNLEPVEEADAKLRDIRGLAISATIPNVTVRLSRTWVRSFTMRSPQVSRLNGGIGATAAGLQGIAANPFLPAATAAALLDKARQIQGFANPFDNQPIYTSLGFDASLDAWRFLGEWTLFDSRSQMVGKYEGYQFTLGRSFGDWTPYVSYARQRRKSPSLDTSAFADTGLDPTLDGGLAAMRAALDQAAAFSDLSMRSISAGVRYDFREGMALKAQYDNFRTPNDMTSGYFAVSRLPLDRNVNLFTVALDVVF